MAFEVFAKSKMCLKGAMKITKFYKNIDWPLDPDNMTWVVIKRFPEQWKALMEHKKEDVSLPPKLTKSSPVHKWLKLMGLYLEKKLGFAMPPFLTSIVSIQMCRLSPLLVRQGSLTPRCTS
jgi:hypothetical protein